MFISQKLNDINSFSLSLFFEYRILFNYGFVKQKINGGGINVTYYIYDKK